MIKDPTRCRIRPDAGWVYSSKERGPNGRGICRQCGVEVPAGRRTFCSGDCVHRFKLQSNPGYLRHEVWKRDRGVCADCGLDTDALRKEVATTRWNRRDATRETLKGLGFKGYAYSSGDFWAADHITPVVEGGGGCGLENMRTLCTPCHRKATAELRRRLAEQRKSDKQAASQPLFAMGADPEPPVDHGPALGAPPVEQDLADHGPDQHQRE